MDRSIKQKLNEKYRNNTKKFCLLISLAVALIFIFSLMGKNLPFPWQFSLTTESVLSDRSEASGRIIIDDNSMEVIFINSNGQVVNTIRSNPKKSEFYTYSSSIISDSGFYLLENLKDGVYVEKEQIVHYRSNGKRDKVVTVLPSEVKDAKNMESSTLSLSTDGTWGYALKELKNDKDVQVYRFPLNGDNVEPELIYTIQDAAGGQKIYYGYYDSNTDAVHICSLHGDIFTSISGKAPEKTGHSDKAVRYIEVNENGEMIIHSQIDSEGSRINYSVSIMIKSWLFWIAVVYLFVLLIIAAVYFLKKVLREKNPESLKKLRTIVIAAFVCIAAFAIVAVYSLEMKKESLRVETKALEAETLELKYLAGDEISAALDEYKTSGTTFGDSISTLEKLFNDHAEIGASRGNYHIPVLFTRNKNGEGIPLTSAYYSMQCGVVYEKYETLLDEVESAEDSVLSSISETAWGDYALASSAVTDSSGEISGCLVIYTDYQALIGDIFHRDLKIFIAILSAAIAVSFILMEGKEWYLSFTSYFKRKKAGEKAAAFTLVRPMFFLSVASNAADSSIATLLAKDLLAKSPYAGNTLMLSLPLVACSLGQFFGFMLFDKACSRFGRRKTTIVGMILTIGFFAMTAAAVSIGNFLLYLIGVVFAALCNIVCEAGTLRLIWTAPDKEQQAEAHRSTSTAVISASSLMGLAAGYASTLFGNATVYILAALPIVLLFVFNLCFVLNESPEAMETQTVQKTKDRLRDSFRFLRRPGVLALLLCIYTTYAFSSSFKSYLFPLFAADEGFNKAAISTIAVIVNALIYFLAPIFRNSEKMFGYRKLIILCNISILFTFGMFLLNGSILWAATALLIVGLAGKACAPSVQMMWPEDAKAAGIPVQRGDVVMQTVNSVYSMLKNPIVGSLLSLGKTAACGIISAFITVATVVYSFVTRKKVE